MGKRRIVSLDTAHYPAKGGLGKILEYPSECEVLGSWGSSRAAGHSLLRPNPQQGIPSQSTELDIPFLGVGRDHFIRQRERPPLRKQRPPSNSSLCPFRRYVRATWSTGCWCSACSHAIPTRFLIVRVTEPPPCRSRTAHRRAWGALVPAPNHRSTTTSATSGDRSVRQPRAVTGRSRIRGETQCSTSSSGRAGNNQKCQLTEIDRISGVWVDNGDAVVGFGRRAQAT